MNLVVGMTEWLPQWRIILNQLGVPAEKVNLSRPLKTDHYAVIIVSGRGGEKDGNNILNYLDAGGAILTEADVGEWLLHTETVPSFVKYVDPVNDPVFPQAVPGSVDARWLLPRNGTLLHSDSQKPLVQTVNRGQGTALILPGLFTQAVLDFKSRRRNFPSPGPWLPSERVSRRSKTTIRSIIEQSLEYLFFQRGLPMVSVWPFPHGESTLFAFRVDTDFATKEQIDNLADLCQQHNIRGTWFVETASAKSYVSLFAQFEDQEIAVHCARHRVFRDYVKNERDIFQALKLISREKIRVRGYAAPFGLWNPALAKAVEHHGFDYSSEFTLDYDNTPFYPYLEDRFTPVLQVPVHPITTGHLLNARHSAEDMKNYWRHRLEDHQRYHLPLIVYDHPAQADLEVLTWLFHEIRERKIPTLPLVDYARWWREKSGISWTAKLEGDTLGIDGLPPDSSLWLNIRKSSSERARIKISETVNLKSLQWQKGELKNPDRTPMALCRTLNRKMITNEILNRYWKLRVGRRGDEEKGSIKEME